MHKQKQGSDIETSRTEMERETLVRLEKIKKTIQASEAAIRQVELRVEETDQMLAKYGLTKDQILHLRLDARQREMVNRALKDKGFPGIDEWSAPLAVRQAVRPDAAEIVPKADLANRQRQFKRMKRRVRL